MLFRSPGQLVRGDARTTADRRLGGARVSASDVLRVAVEPVSDRWRRPMARWRSALNGGLWLVFLLPGVFLGVALIGLLNRPGLTWLYAGFGVVFLALGLRYFAPVQSAVVAALQASDRELYEAADLAGAGAWTRFQWVTWPQSGGSLLAVGYAVYLLCLWDVETLVLIQPPGGETLALRIFNLLHYGHAAQVNALCIVLLGIALAPLIAYGIIERLSRRWISSKNTAGAGVLALGLGLGLVGCTPPTDIAEVHELESKIFSGVQTIGSRGVAPGQFNKPRSLICDRADNLYVTDMTGRIQKFSADGRFLLQWQMPQTEIGKPKGMTLDPVGNIVVVEPHYQRVNHFTPEGKLVAQWGRRGAQPGEFILPRCVAINSMGEYYLGEYTTVERIQKFTLPEVPGPVAGLKSATGWPATLAVTWGQPGQGPGDLNRAEGIAVGPGDRVYVADSCNHRIQVFDSGGKFIREHGRAGSHPGELSYPYDVRVERSGRQFVCEFGNSRISIFDASDRLIETIGKAGVGAGQFANPWAICLDSKGNLYVADSQNHRVQKLLRRAAGKGTLAFTGVDSIGVGAPHSADTVAGTVSWFH